MQGEHEKEHLSVGGVEELSMEILEEQKAGRACKKRRMERDHRKSLNFQNEIQLTETTGMVSSAASMGPIVENQRELLP